MASPKEPQYERYWRERIASEIDSLLAESWGNDLDGLAYSDGVYAASQIALKGTA